MIGGTTKAEGNVLVGSVSCSPYYDGVNFLVENNLFDINSNNDPPGGALSSDARQIYFNSNSPTGTLLSQINIINNVIPATIRVSDFNNLALTIQSNIFGTNPVKSLSYAIDGPAISLINVQGTTLIGGPGVALGNTFTAAVQASYYTLNATPVVSVQGSNTVELSHNSFYCNNDSPLVYVDDDYTNKPVKTTIDALNATTATGTSKPSARVELFYTDKECTSCQPKTYIGSVNADAGGNWVYNTAFSPGYGVMVAGTLNHVSSEFTDPRLIEGNIVVQDVTCTQMGSITGAIVVNGAQVTWSGPNGPIPGNTPDLTNVPAGIYTLEVNQFGCIKKSVAYTIMDYRPFVNDNGRTITPATCGGSNGSITGLVPNSNVLSVTWLDAKGNAAGSNIDLTNVPAGIYTLQLTGGKCTNTYGPVTIGTTANVITITPGSEQIGADQCSLNTGSVKGITFSGGTAPFTYSWKNAADNVVGTGLDIENLTAGTYTLNISDSVPCDAGTATYTINGSSEIIDPPVVSNIKVCGYDAILRVANPAAGYRYRLYNSPTDTAPADEQVSGVFDIKLATTINYYYVSQLIGSCESARTRVEAQYSTETFSVTNAITPNGDGINDYWDIKGLDAYPAASVKIFNRNGGLIYQSIGYAKPFDGTYNGRKLPDGVYYYIIDIGSACKLLSGSITVLR